MAIESREARLAHPRRRAGLADCRSPRGDFTKPIFDWRQLQRWNISEASLPPGSEIRFRPPTMWEQYRWQMMAILVAVLLQAAIIGWLLFERYRRRRAEMESRGRMREVIHLNRTATAGALSASIAHELNQPLGAILSNAEAAELLLTANPPDLEQVRGDSRRHPAGRSARGRHHPAPAKPAEARRAKSSCRNST